MDELKRIKDRYLEQYQNQATEILKLDLPEFEKKAKIAELRVQMLKNFENEKELIKSGKSLNIENSIENIAEENSSSENLIVESTLETTKEQTADKDELVDNNLVSQIEREVSVPTSPTLSNSQETLQRVDVQPMMSFTSETPIRPATDYSLFEPTIQPVNSFIVEEVTYNPFSDENNSIEKNDDIEEIPNVPTSETVKRFDNSFVRKIEETPTTASVETAAIEEQEIIQPKRAVQMDTKVETSPNIEEEKAAKHQSEIFEENFTETEISDEEDTLNFEQEISSEKLLDLINESREKKVEAEVEKANEDRFNSNEKLLEMFKESNINKAESEVLEAETVENKVEENNIEENNIEENTSKAFFSELEEPTLSDLNDELAFEEQINFYQPIVEEPIIEEPIIEEPIIEEPIIEEPIIEEPIVEEPIIEEPIIEEPIVEEPIVEEPIIEEPIIEEPIIEEPIIEEPIIEEPIIEEPIIEEPIIEEPIVEEPIVEEPIVEEPIVEESIIEEPIVEESIIEEQIVEESIIEEDDEYKIVDSDKEDTFFVPEDKLATKQFQYTPMITKDVIVNFDSDEEDEMPLYFVDDQELETQQVKEIVEEKEDIVSLEEQENLISEDEVLTEEKEVSVSEDEVLVEEQENLISEDEVLAEEKEVSVSEDEVLVEEQENLASKEEVLAEEHESNFVQMNEFFEEPVAQFDETEVEDEATEVEASMEEIVYYNPEVEDLVISENLIRMEDEAIEQTEETSDDNYFETQYFTPMHAEKTEVKAVEQPIDNLDFETVSETFAEYPEENKAVSTFDLANELGLFDDLVKEVEASVPFVTEELEPKEDSVFGQFAEASLISKSVDNSDKQYEVPDTIFEQFNLDINPDEEIEISDNLVDEHIVVEMISKVEQKTQDLETEVVEIEKNNLSDTVQADNTLNFETMLNELEEKVIDEEAVVEETIVEELAVEETVAEETNTPLLTFDNLPVEELVELHVINDTQSEATEEVPVVEDEISAENELVSEAPVVEELAAVVDESLLEEVVVGEAALEKTNETVDELAPTLAQINSELLEKVKFIQNELEEIKNKSNDTITEQLQEIEEIDKLEDVVEEVDNEATDKISTEELENLKYTEEFDDIEFTEELDDFDYTEDLEEYTEELDEYTEELDEYTEELDEYTEELDEYTEELDEYTEELDDYEYEEEDYLTTAQIVEVTETLLSPDQDITDIIKATRELNEVDTAETTADDINVLAEQLNEIDAYDFNEDENETSINDSDIVHQIEQKKKFTESKKFDIMLNVGIAILIILIIAITIYAFSTK
ncbi:MAG: hypothetical protein ACRCUP_04795 [Mycoplasmatales bacterium]